VKGESKAEESQPGDLNVIEPIHLQPTSFFIVGQALLVECLASVIKSLAGQRPIYWPLVTVSQAPSAPKGSLQALSGKTKIVILFQTPLSIDREINTSMGIVLESFCGERSNASGTFGLLVR
jgi:hypothetical protein